MMKNLFLCLLLIVFSVVSCKSSSEKEIETLQQELIHGHDAVMPKSMAIPTIKQKMLQAVENSSEENKDVAAEIAKNLDSDEAKMNEWMVAFGDAINSKNPDKLEVYKKLKGEISALEKSTQSNIDRAKKLTEQLSVK